MFTTIMEVNQGEKHPDNLIIVHLGCVPHLALLHKDYYYYMVNLTHSQIPLIIVKKQTFVICNYSNALLELIKLAQQSF